MNHGQFKELPQGTHYGVVGVTRRAEAKRRRAKPLPVRLVASRLIPTSLDQAAMPRAARLRLPVPVRLRQPLAFLVEEGCFL